jgi:hypothetical protein
MGYAEAVQLDRFNPATGTEGHIYAKHILATKPDAKIGVLRCFAPSLRRRHFGHIHRLARLAKRRPSKADAATSLSQSAFWQPPLPTLSGFEVVAEYIAA